ncbi:MAG: SMP-30/gluconolactonase/LRE family protein [Panacagrimonas sp.]
MKRILWTVPAMLVVYLLVWPVPIQPIAWTPPVMPSSTEGPYARNDKLRGVQRIADGGVDGPEAIAFDANGRLFTGLGDGRIVSMGSKGSDCRVIGNTGGRPLGLHVQSDGAVLIADAVKGLLRLGYDGQVEQLAVHAEGIRIGFADDLDVDADGRVYFSDASWKFGWGEQMNDVFEHGARGRLIRYDATSGDATTFLAELHFANGVALGPEQAFVLINETTEYKITRYWLKGDKAATRETFIDNLPGFPDNVTFNGRDRFWVALYAPRNAMLDALLPLAFVRTVVARLPEFLHPKPRRQGFVIGLDLDGKLVEQYQYDGDDAFGPITSVREHEGMLYLGSLSETAVGRIALDELRKRGPGSAPPAAIAGSCSG